MNGKEYQESLHEKNLHQSFSEIWEVNLEVYTAWIIKTY